MNKIIRNILLVHIGVLLAISIALSEGKISEVLVGISFIGFFMGPIDLFFAIVMYIAMIGKPGPNYYAQGFALSGALISLASFTLCSTGFGLKI